MHCAAHPPNSCPVSPSHHATVLKRQLSFLLWPLPPPVKICPHATYWLDCSVVEGPSWIGVSGRTNRKVPPTEQRTHIYIIKYSYLLPPTSVIVIAKASSIQLTWSLFWTLALPAPAQANNQARQTRAKCQCGPFSNSTIILPRPMCPPHML